MAEHAGARIVEVYGYKGCVELSNSTTRVVLEPNVGGRVLIYALNGTNALFNLPEETERRIAQGEKLQVQLNPSGGRCDIGPEMVSPRRPQLFTGKWEARITAPRAAQMISVRDPDTGVQLIRDFQLDENSSHLRFTQTILNISSKTQRYGHWSRTLATGHGICLIPLNKRSRYPKGYILYGPGKVMDFAPDDEPGIRVREGILEVSDTPSRPKFAIDSEAGWLAYLTTQNQLFVKKFPVLPEGMYGEMAGNSVSIWYFEDKVCELEPIGPWEIIQPGQSSSFTEDWWLLDYPFPKDREVDLTGVKRMVEQCRVPI